MKQKEMIPIVMEQYTVVSRKNFDKNLVNVLVEVKTGNVIISKNDQELATQIVEKFSTFQAAFFQHRS